MNIIFMYPLPLSMAADSLNNWPCKETDTARMRLVRQMCRISVFVSVRVLHRALAHSRESGPGKYLSVNQSV